jgi:hypothetical protein
LRDSCEATPQRSEQTGPGCLRPLPSRRRPDDEEEITRIVTAYATRKEPREIAEAVRNSARIYGTIATFSCRHPRQLARHFRPKADVDRKAVEALAKMYGGISLLQGLSPADPTAWTAQSLLDGLFPGNFMLCLAQNQHAPFTLPRDYFRGQEHRFPLLVPSPMSAPLGRNQQGRGSIRCLDNNGPGRCLVVEFDKGTIDEQASALIHLARIGPLVLVTHSGGRSLQGSSSYEPLRQEYRYPFWLKYRRR